MNHQSSASYFRPGFISILSLVFSMLFLICIGPGSTLGLASQVKLAWDANTDPGVAGYKLYYGTASRTYGTPVDVGKVTEYNLSGVEEGKNCYFAVTAYDTNRNESAFSTELECFTLVPAPVLNGVLSPSNAVVVSRGMNQTFTVTPAANYAIADVLVDAASAGTVSTYTFSNVDRNHTLSASFASVSYSHLISASAGVNGTISPSGSVSVAQGASHFFTITANTGYQVQDVKVDGASVGPVSSYSFSNVTAAHSIAATFVAKTYTIYASSGSYGAVTPLSASVSHGDYKTFTITPNTGYQVKDVLVDGVSVGSVTSYTFANITTSHTIAATFAAKNYAISASAGSNGTISPSGSVSVAQGASQSFTITANKDYQVKDVLVDGKSVGAVTSYTFSNVTVAHSIAASFAVNNKYTISASADSGGIIWPSGNVQVQKNAKQVFSITPNTGYRVKNVIVDGVSIGAVTSYTFSKVTVNHTISASFNSLALLELNFDEGTGSTALDCSGTGGHGTISGAVYTSDSAVGPHALSFYGNSYVTVQAKASLKPFDFSIAFWVNHASDTSNSYGGILQGAYGDGKLKGYGVYDCQNKPVGVINFGDADGISISGNPFVQGEWTHIVLTYDHKKISLYQNGSLVNEVSEIRNINWDVNALNLTIGLAHQFYFSGLIDNVQMYDYALSPQEIDQLYVE